MKRRIGLCGEWLPCYILVADKSLVVFVADILMRRANLDFTVTISVDGVLRDQRTIWAHQQQDPYPGGHRYEIVMQGEAVLEQLQGLPLDVNKRLSAKEANAFLQRVCFTFEAPEQSIPLQFVLNTIDAVRCEGTSVWIGGECSPFVHASTPTSDAEPSASRE